MNDSTKLPRIVLASHSPRRREILALAGYDFQVAPSSFDETTAASWPPERHVHESSRGKAEDVARGIDDGIVVGADTIVVINRLILGKPADEEDARRMLKLLSGRSHYVYTGLCLVLRKGGVNAASLCDSVRTEVRFGKLSDEIIDAYIATGEPMDKAGAYGIQGRGCVLVEGIVGDYFNVVGLPIFRLNRMLQEIADK